MLLGIDWLEEQHAIWDMRSGELYMHGSVFPSKPNEMGVGFDVWLYRRLSNIPREVRLL